MARTRKRTPKVSSKLFNPPPQVDGVYSEEVEQCSTCLWWTTPRRKRTCKQDRKCKIDGDTRRGTPYNYSCEEYTQLNVAKCGECDHWTDERRPRAKAPCSELSLMDDQKRPRSKGSTYCKHFSQTEPFEVTNNFNLRFNGLLAQIVDLNSHSEPMAFLLRQDPSAGLMCVWTPAGPGEGAWSVMPVELTDIDEGDLEVKQYLDVEHGRNHNEVAFAGSAELVMAAGHTEKIGAQALRRGRRDRGLQGAVVGGLSLVRFAMRTARKRIFDNFVPDVEDAPEVEKKRKKAKRVQDEPWGVDWADLTEQADVLIESDMSNSAAALYVQRSYFRQVNNRTLTNEDGKRLQRQLMQYIRRDDGKKE